MTAPPLPLAGRVVAITRAKGGDDALRSRLLELGAEVLETPAIAIGPPSSYEDLDAALRALPAARWVLFASVTAVERTVARAHAIDLPASTLVASWLRFGAVGKATAACLARLLRPPDLVPPEATGKALAEALAPGVHGLGVLVPRAEEGRPELVGILRRAGAVVLAPAAYRTVPAPRGSLDPLAQALERGRVDAVVFASPSAVRNAVSGLGPAAALLPQAVVAVMGPTTSAEATALGLKPAVQPARAWARDLADALAAHFAARPG